ncbi:unnamed protein product [Onchocerca flexuosa]|uniref:Uncharacterized protein n=1 Tax=Onchocerca flexuosa TaxID=387005 RepID=A0A183HP32_9BILA|nr:unnamed protein product [Onchocerca flexuosa]
MSAVDEVGGSHDGTLLASEPARGHHENLIHHCLQLKIDFKIAYFKYYFQAVEEGTLRGPNKPLPPTPTDQSPVSDIPGDDGTLLASHKVNGSIDHRRCNSDSSSKNRQSQMVKAASMPDQTPIAAEIIIDSGSSGSEGSGSSSEASPFDARKNSNRTSSSAASGQRCGVMPDLLPRTPVERSTPFLAFTKDGSSPSIESQSAEEVIIL